MPICGNWIIPPARFAIQNDDHDQQNDGSSSRDMGDKGSVLIKEKDAGKHRGFPRERLQDEAVKTYPPSDFRARTWRPRFTEHDPVVLLLMHRKPAARAPGDQGAWIA